MPKKKTTKKTTKKDREKLQKEVDKEIKKNFSDTPLLTPIENSEKDIKDIKVQKEEKAKKSPSKKTNIILNIILGLLVLAIILIAIDVVCVSKYNKGPYFAIPVKKYKDGGTKTYIGLGYKVIDYNQKQGRRDKTIGLWTMKYYTEPRNIVIFDLAIEFEEDAKAALKNYYKQFIRVTGEVKEIDEKNNKMILEFADEGGKYIIDLDCSMAEKDSLKDLKKGDNARLIGTITGFAMKTKKLPNTVFIEDCFAEKVTEE
ncbi:MAG: hypothetical protein IJI43_03970 [Bacilli bacterium]|nr:hypothetical protein [Bacilli bacterium]